MVSNLFLRAASWLLAAAALTASAGLAAAAALAAGAAKLALANACETLPRQQNSMALKDEPSPKYTFPGAGTKI